MKMFGMITSSEIRVIHYGNKPNPEKPQRHIYLQLSGDSPLGISQLWVRDDKVEFKQGEEIELEIKIKQ